MKLPKITFEDVIVPATKPPREKWEYWNSNYLIAPHLFDKDIAKAEQVVDALVNDVGLGHGGGLGRGGGLGTDGSHILEGLKDRREVKILRRWTGLRKVPAVAALIRGELDAGAYAKIVVFGMYQDALMELRDALKDYGAVMLFEGTPPDKRNRIIKRFQANDGCKVFIGHIPAAAVAIDLTVAHEVAVVEADWKAVMNPGAIMRCHNARQTKPVRVRFFALKDSYDVRVQRALKIRARIAIDEFHREDEIPSPFDD